MQDNVEKSTNHRSMYCNFIEQYIVADEHP